LPNSQKLLNIKELVQSGKYSFVYLQILLLHMNALTKYKETS